MLNDSSIRPDPGSYRDPAGFVFTADGIIHRQVNQSWQRPYEQLMNSGAYDKFVRSRLLIPHETINQNLTGSSEWFTTIRPDKIPFISYPYEWSFEMLKEAALLTLDLATQALGYNLILKDATPYNVQWHQGRMIFIDTLSFDLYREADPWIAYRQFCECFAAPLLLMSYSSQPLQQLMLAWPEGVPLQVTRKLLPFRSRFNLNVFLHIHLHGRVAAGTPKPEEKNRASFSRTKMRNLLSSLTSMITSLSLPEQKSTWINYYDEASTRDNYLEEKKKIITTWIGSLTEVATVADLGANEGEFSSITAAAGKYTVAADLDPFCIDRLYRNIRREKINNIQPIVMDLTLPSPAIGINNVERPSFIERINPDLVMGLALIHHLLIGKNMEAAQLALFFSRLCKNLILEYVPVDDAMTQVLLSHKTRTYPFYNPGVILQAFEKYFRLDQEVALGDSGRKLWLLRKL